MNRKLDAAAAAAMLAELDDVFIVTHEKPDGDAFGSALGLGEIMRANGRRATVLLPDPLPEKYVGFAGDGFAVAVTREEIASFAAVVVLDAARSGRIAFGGGLTLNDFAVPVLNLDHHIDNDIADAASCVRSDCAAAAELVCEVVRLIPGWKITPRAAEFLLLGIITDTGSFRFTNTTGATFRAAAFLLECGANLETLCNLAFFAKPWKQQQFESEMLQTCVRSHFGGKYLCAVLPDALFAKYGFDMRDGEAVIDLLREVSGVVICALIYRRGSGCKVSLRGKDRRYPVGPIARHFGGGGHEMAAGITLEGRTLAEAEALLLESVNQTLENHAL